MEDIGADRFLLLSGACPGEGVWCWARTYTELVECARTAWGADFRPIFKYKLPCTLTDANAHTRREVAEETPQPQEEALVEEAVGAGLSASAPSKTRPSACLVVLNDADDFHMWRRGGAYVSAADPTASPDATTSDVRDAFVHHHGSPAGSAQEIMHTVAHHMDHHRLTSEARTAGETAATAAAGEAGHKERVWKPRPLTSTLYAFRSGVPSTDFPQAPQRQYKGSTACSERARTRASPPVRRADADVIQVPLQCILDPALIIRLNVTVVLRHSAAPAEVIFFSSHTPSGQGMLPWGALCVKARQAWGVHSPQFRYVDLTNGVTQVLINHVNDYRAWWQQGRLTNCELLVVEQAPSATRGSAFTSAVAQTAIGRYYEEEWPVERYSSSKHVVELVRELKALEQEERMAAVQRLGRAAKVLVHGDLAASARAATPRRPTNTSCEAPKIDAPSASSSEAAAVASMATLAESRTLDPYRPLLLQKPQKPLSTTSTLSRGRCCSTPSTVSSTATTPSRAPLTTEEKIDEEMWSSFLDAERYARLMSFVSAEHPDTAVVSSGSDPELKASSERVARIAPGDTEAPLRRSRQWLFAKRTSPEPKGVAAKATAGHGDGQVRTPFTAVRKDAAGATATANGVSDFGVAAMNEPVLDAHVRARLHNALLSDYFRTHAAYPVSARGIGATPIR
ncbi:conserved hypothetical protein [Leishmania mexicana MHOM/GT/2001/U1103]|uniref:Uncharacterized protein n=1 Tax=Leishmania mexicana (strain MHOM/GT/2001/U1103) TaxID=929439 RepID=E9AQJ3_LEIMU|nr:conserved hypothetical protein [Leishmania mexicana MHOM/GT/2001/U1103]CBZ25212.1 conserved hypothetical protein [Leishmania mexicana MHOM/GT/2001/U1103]